MASITGTVSLIKQISIYLSCLGHCGGSAVNAGNKPVNIRGNCRMQKR